jgi:hypothetical protein
MTEPINPASPTFDIAAAMARLMADEADHKRRAEALHPANKQALFDKLEAADITEVVVTFDGYGDSGQIEEITARSGDNTVSLPNGEITIASVAWRSEDVTRTTMSVDAALEQLAYEFLSETHGGWQDNDGAYGDFTFDVASRTITLDFNERYTASETYSHEF